MAWSPWGERKETIKTNRGFWIPKIERNMQRDKEMNQALEDMGYMVFRFWSKNIQTERGKCIQDVLVYRHTGTIY